MKNRFSVILSTTALLTSAVVQLAFASTDRPNILLILIDDQSWNGTSVQFDPDIPGSRSDFYQTANLERLAAQGMRFSNAYSAAAVCSPTRAALVTGKSPWQLQYNDIYYDGSIRGFGGHPLTPPQTLPLDASRSVGIAQRVKDADSSYDTALIGKWHIAGASPSDVGFDYWTEANGGGASDPRSVHAKSAAAIGFIENSVANDKPFFLELSHIAVHDPYLASPESLAKYQALPPGTYHNNATYAAYTEDLDNSIGTVLDRLDSLGIADNTYIIYASDNGAVNNVSRNHPLTGGKKSIFDGGIRTPFIISGPGIEANSVSDVLTTTVDIYSTISALAGNTSPLPEGVEGADLSPVIFNGGELPDGMPYLERTYAENGAIYFLSPSNIASGPAYRTRPMAAVRQGDYKLLRIFGENGNPDQNLLFDFANSQQEVEGFGTNIDVTAQYPDVTAEMIQLLDNWIQAADVSLPYNVAAPTKIEWATQSIRGNSYTWRSVSDVNEKQRESWDITGGPDFTDTNSSYSELPSQALSFDGNDAANRQSFFVSDGYARLSNTRYPTGTPDFDRSVTFEFWVRLDDVDDSHMVFESGVTTSGLSFTIGDVDGDGTFTDGRLRLVGNTGNSLVLTTDLAAFADLTSEFAQIALVFDDSASSRSASIFVNGQLAGQELGLTGDENSIRWDRFYQGVENAKLGSAASSQVGGASGSGDMPFLGAGLRGDIAKFTFYNYILDSDDLMMNFLSVTNPALFADFNGDGFVDAADYTVWRDNLGLTGDGIAADGNRDGVVDQNDYLLWRRNFGTVVNAELIEPTNAVPEPTSAALLVVAFVIAISCRRNDRVLL